MANAGNNVALNITGTSTAMTNEPMTQTGATKRYFTTLEARNVWDGGVLPVVRDNGSIVDPSNYTIDFLLGLVVFDAGYTVTGSVTVTASYLPRYPIAAARSFSVSRQRNLPESTTFDDDAKNRIPGQKDVSVSIERIELADDMDTSGDTLTWDGLLDSGDTFVVEIQPDADDDYTIRVRALLETITDNSTPDDVVNEQITLTGAGAAYDPDSYSAGDPTA